MYLFKQHRILITQPRLVDWLLGLVLPETPGLAPSETAPLALGQDLELVGRWLHLLTRVRHWLGVLRRKRLHPEWADVLQALLARWPNVPKVDLVTTDGFLYPNAVLESRGLMQRKGFPESYDVRRLVQFMSDIKAGAAVVQAPVYSHQSYDIVPGEYQVVDRPDIVIVEGLNMLQTGDGSGRAARIFVSDFFDFSIYIDADEGDIERWYIERFLRLRETVFQNPRSYFHRYAALSDGEAVETARGIWRNINGLNLRENIQPTRDRARLVLEKGPDHAVRRVHLRTL